MTKRELTEILQEAYDMGYNAAMESMNDVEEEVDPIEEAYIDGYMMAMEVKQSNMVNSYRNAEKSQRYMKSNAYHSGKNVGDDNGWIASLIARGFSESLCAEIKDAVVNRGYSKADAIAYYKFKATRSGDKEGYYYIKNSKKVPTSIENEIKKYAK